MIRVSASAAQILAHSDPSVTWEHVTRVVASLAAISVQDESGGDWFPIAVRAMPRVVDGQPVPADLLLLELEAPPPAIAK